MIDSLFSKTILIPFSVQFHSFLRELTTLSSKKMRRAQANKNQTYFCQHSLSSNKWSPTLNLFKLIKSTWIYDAKTILKDDYVEQTSIGNFSD